MGGAGWRLILHFFLGILALAFGALESDQELHFLCIQTKIKVMVPTSVCNLIEWLEYNFILGVDHIFINDDCSGSQELLSPVLDYYQAKGLLTPIRSFEKSSECASYIPNEGITYRRMFFARTRAGRPGGGASLKCHWIANLDPDEYVSFWRSKHNNTNRVAQFLRKLPQSSANTISTSDFVRMPWWVYGNYGHEKRPAALVIDSYFSASLEKPRYIKTIARVSKIGNFQSPHVPQIKDELANSSATIAFPAGAVQSDATQISAEILVITNQTQGDIRRKGKAGTMSLERLVHWNGLHSFERRPTGLTLLGPSRPALQQSQAFSADRRLGASPALISELSPPQLTVLVPATQLFIKHYKYLSWDEFRGQRAATPTLPNGRTNYWGIGARDIWEKGNHSQPWDINLAEDFTADMVLRLRDAVRRRLTLMSAPDSGISGTSSTIGVGVKAAKALQRECGAFWNGFYKT